MAESVGTCAPRVAAALTSGVVRIEVSRAEFSHAVDDARGPQGIAGGLPIAPVALGEALQAAVSRLTPEVNRLHRQPGHEEAIVILEGAGAFRVGDEVRAVGPGDFIFVPRDTVHGFTAFRSASIAFLSLMTPQIDLVRDVVWEDAPAAQGLIDRSN